MEPTLLEEAIKHLRAAQKLIDVQVTIRRAARRLARAEGATFVLRDSDKCFYADEDAMSPLWKGQRFPITQCISGWAMLNDDVAIVPDITEDERVPIEAYRPTFVKSLVMVPVGRPKPVAAIGAYWARVHQPTEQQLQMLRDLAHEAAVALDRVGLQDAPFTPSLTGS
jgi:GAF domain-containing protein